MNRPYRVMWIVTGVLGAAVVAGCGAANRAPARSPSASSPAGAAAPDFSLTDLSGNKFKLSDMKGQVVFINFFATWCPPCRAEMPELVKLNSQYGSDKVKIVSISVDDKNSIAEVKPFAEKNSIRHPVLSGSDSMAVARKYGVNGIPANFLIGPNGQIVQQWEGYSDEEPARWREAIKSALSAT